jgi:hypothetical protein
MKKIIVILSLISAVSACQGRDPLIGQNDPTVEPPPPPPPPPEPRTLERRRLFGDMPLDNRFQDPLITFTGTGWFGFSNNFNSYPNMVRRIDESPSKSPILSLPIEGNASGATILGQLKTATTPLHVEVWIGREAESGEDPSTAQVGLVGLFVGEGEQTVPLVADESSRTTINGAAWVRFTADLDEGPVGWSFLVAGDNEAGKALLLSGPVAVDLPANAGSAIVSSSKRAVNARERAMVDAAREKTRQLSNAKKDAPKPINPLIENPLARN